MRNVFQILIVLTAVFGLGLGAAFAGGVYWGRRDQPAPAATQTAGSQAGAPGAGAAGGLPGGAGAAAAQATTGVVEAIDGETVTVRTAAGGTVAIKLQPDTQVRQLAAAAPSDIRPGLNVVIQGQPDIDGKVAARSVQITGAGGPAGGAAGQAAPGTRTPGQRPGATPTPAP